MFELDKRETPIGCGDPIVGTRLSVAPACVHQLFERQTQITPARVAAVFGTQTITYAELNSKANQMAHYLLSEGLASGDLVGVFLERSMEMLISVLAIVKAGGAYVPLDPANPSSRTSYIVNDCKAKFLITSHSMGEISGSDAKRLLVETFYSKTDLSPRNPSAKISPNDRAYVIYTSGSTGNPKGVEISHHSLVNFLISMQSEPGISSEDTLVSVTTLSFDIAGLELFLPLSVGAKVIIAPTEVVTDGIALKHLLESSEATMMQATPTSWRMLLDADWSGSKTLKILCGGEPMPRMLANQLLARCGELWNMYGPTETTIWSTLYKVKKETGPVPIGKAISNTQTYIVDESLKPVSEGTPGELLIGGDGIAIGYLYRNELTNEKFIKNPFGAGRLYKTGDIARVRRDGLIECLGRTDDQIKIRGFRVELGEIENTLAAVNSVSHLVAVTKDDPAGEKKLVAYVKANENMKLDLVELRKLATEKLPDYMNPSHYVVVDRFPLTANGKVDRKSLPEPDWSDIQSQQANAEFESPIGEIELKMAEIWSQILGVKEVSRPAEFKNLGGTSISLTRLSRKISETFDLQIPINILHARGSLVKMSDEVAKRMNLSER